VNQLESLALRAKTLTIGMFLRSGRHPDTADYLAAFEDELARHKDSQTCICPDLLPRQTCPIHDRRLLSR
jgi:hypothetical protein